MEKDPTQWVQYERKGQNIGARIMLNPAIFSEMTQAIGGKQNVTIVDIGAGTGRLSREFLLEDVHVDPALHACARRIQEVRGNVSSMMNFDNQKHYIDVGKRLMNDERVSFEVAAATELPLEDESVDLAVSRQVLMHLSPDELDRHFNEIRRVLRRKCAYIFTVTNPGVEHLKHVLSQGCTVDSILSAGQAYQYPHGEVAIPEYIQGSAREIISNMIGAKRSGEGTAHFLNQYFHTPVSYIIAGEKAGLWHRKTEDLHAVIPGFETSHARYYRPALPSSILYKFTKS